MEKKKTRLLIKSQWIFIAALAVSVVHSNYMNYSTHQKIRQNQEQIREAQVMQLERNQMSLENQEEILNQIEEYLNEIRDLEEILQSVQK